MIVFHPTYSYRRLGQDQSAAASAAPAAPAPSVVSTPSGTGALTAPASAPASSGSILDQKVNLPVAALGVAAIVLVGLTATFMESISKYR